jgi:argininosuccinate synthase
MQFPLAYSKKLLYIYEVSHDNVNLKNHFYRILKEDFEMKEKVVLAYSGGLDTTAIIPWLKEHFDYDVVCCCIDCGQGSELDGLQERAKLSGASKLYIEDLVDDFAENYIVPCVQANATYENKYLLGTSMARPAIAKRLVEIARKEGAVAICHGATGKGNDQIRFELGIKALAPDIKIIAPWRMTDVWTMQSREDEIEYCKQHGIDLPFAADSSYSRDRNLWHISHEGLELEDPANEPNYDHLLVLGVSPEKAPDEGEYVTMTFEKGVPTSVNGEKMKVADIIRKLNTLGGKHGIGIVDIVENRVVGMKSRGVYETPGGTILMEAHKQLEELVLDRATMEVKKEMGDKLAQVVYEGKWFTPLCDAIRAFVTSTQEYVTGEVKFKLYKGNIIKAGTTSPYSLYSESLASFTTGDLYDHHDADGFITLFGLPLKVRAMKMAELKKNETK